jgi:hypothetical protein
VGDRNVGYGDAPGRARRMSPRASTRVLAPVAEVPALPARPGRRRRAGSWVELEEMHALCTIYIHIPKTQICIYILYVYTYIPSRSTLAWNNPLGGHIATNCEALKIVTKLSAHLQQAALDMHKEGAGKTGCSTLSSMMLQSSMEFVVTVGKCRSKYVTGGVGPITYPILPNMECVRKD